MSNHTVILRSQNLAIVALILGLVMTGLSARSVIKSESRPPPVPAEERGGPWMCPPTLSEMLPVEGPPLNIGGSILFVIGLLVTYRSALHLIGSPR